MLHAQCLLLYYMDKEGTARIKELNISNDNSYVHGTKAGCESWKLGSALCRWCITLYFLEQAYLEGALVYMKACVLGCIIFGYSVIHLFKLLL